MFVKTPSIVALGLHSVAHHLKRNDHPVAFVLEIKGPAVHVRHSGEILFRDDPEVDVLGLFVRASRKADDRYKGCQQKQDSFLGSMMLNVKFRQS